MEHSTWQQWRVFVVVMLLGAAGLLFSAAALAVDAKKTSVFWHRSNASTQED